MEKIKSKNLFLLFLYINVFCKAIGLSNDDKIYMMLLIFGIFILIFKIVTDKFTKKQLLYFAIIILIAFCSFIVGKKTTLLLTCLCLAGMKNIDVDKTFNGMFKIRLITFIAVVVLALVGVLENTQIYMWRDGGYDLRYTLGFTHPNTLHLSLFILISLYIYCKFDKLNLIDYIFLIASNLLIFSFSNSRTGIIVIMLLICITILSKNKLIKQLILKLPIYIYIGLILVTFLTAYMYGKIPIMYELDEMLNGRIAYSHYYLEMYGLTLLGSDISIDTNALFDNGYLYMYTQFGIIGFILISSWIFKICSKTKKEKNKKRAILIICYLIYIFTESFAPNIFMNIILLFVADNIFSKDEEVRHEKIQYNSSSIQC